MKNIHHLINDDGFLKTLLEAIPCSILIIDQNLQVQTINNFLERTFDIEKDTILDTSRKVGDFINCIVASKDAKSCGNDGLCQNCEILSVAYEALNGGEVHRKKMKLRSMIRKNWQDLILLVSAAPVNYNNEKFALLLLEDITELNTLRLQTRMENIFAGLVGHNSKMLELFESIEELAQVDVAVLIQGESGTGKELVASAIHHEGKRATKPFIAVNCGALPETLLESELFGHVRGAFTGATRDKKGRFEMANEGTIFLDELSDISPMMQVKLLRVLQEGTFERVGSEVTTKVNVRVVSATNKDIQKELAAGRMRQDLYYRLCVVPLYIPPLRERRDDIPLLADHFLKEAVVELGHEMTRLSPAALEIMINYQWPGNIRELQNVIRYSLVKCKGPEIESHHLPPNLLPTSALISESRSPKKRIRKRKLDAQSVDRALKKTNGNKVETARLLGVSRATLYRFLDEEHSIVTP